ncbi:hypothetical protein, partial [uncultured Eudoraea sp.]|uniref:hypothetical protein n=1 Tax=uncultured Eudoraea sp. TaxID=1035614 RepID=UPI00260C6E3C
MNNKMSGTNSVFHCVIDGKLSKAQLLKCSGGGVSRKKAEHALASSHEVPGGLTGKLTHEPITIECSLAMGKSLTDWCNEAFRMNPA